MKGKPVRFHVPSYSQHYDFTCGPASLMMALKCFDRKIRLTEDLEIDIWREANMVEIYGTSRYGLAYSAAVRGFKVRVLSNIAGYGFVNKLRPHVQGVNKQMLRQFFDERKKRCLKLGVKDERCAITPEIIRNCLASGSIPLLLTNAKHFTGEDIPHWIPVTGFDDERFYLNNPLGKDGDSSVSLDVFKRLVGYKADQCLVTITQTKPSVKKQRHFRP